MTKKDSANQVINNNNNNNPVNQNSQTNADNNNQNNLNQPKEENKNNQFTSGPTINPSKLAGDWSTNGAEIYLGNDGSMEWYVLNNGDNATGTCNFIITSFISMLPTSKPGNKRHGSLT